MQILGNDFCQAPSGLIINIHHSLLPGFKGSKPYLHAWARVLKLIGATGALRDCRSRRTDDHHSRCWSSKSFGYVGTHGHCWP
ncbi:MAG: formyltransferase family protein [Acidimicrobiales bacterium]